MSRYMTDEEIAAEQELIRQQQAESRFNLSSSAENAALVSDEEAHAVTPFDLLSSDNYTTREVRDERFGICKECDRLFKPTKSCRECGCFMALKTWLKDATCALPPGERKWEAAP